MSDPLELNLAGRVLLAVHRYGVTEQSRIMVFVRAIMDVIAHQFPEERPSLRELEPLITEQLVLIQASLATSQAMGGMTICAPPPAVDLEQHADAPAQDAQQEPRHKPALNGNTAKSMEQKLQDGRKPVQKLLTDECVSIGLIDQAQADDMIRSMLGRQPEEAESAIVEQLRQILQDQVKSTIRQDKDGPWSTPQKQEELRKDIHAAGSVKSIVMLTRHIIKERRTWENENGKGGMLGLFAGRKRLVG